MELTINNEKALGLLNVQFVGAVYNKKKNGTVDYFFKNNIFLRNYRILDNYVKHDSKIERSVPLDFEDTKSKMAVHTLFVTQNDFSKMDDRQGEGDT